MAAVAVHRIVVKAMAIFFFMARLSFFVIFIIIIANIINYGK